MQSVAYIYTQTNKVAESSLVTKTVKSLSFFFLRCFGGAKLETWQHSGIF